MAARTITGKTTRHGQASLALATRVACRVSSFASVFPLVPPYRDPVLSQHIRLGPTL